MKLTTSSLRQSFDRRTFVIGAVQGGVGLLLAARMGYIAVAENEKYEMEAESNRVNLSLIPPRRGWILDRHGKPLASNQADFRVDIIPERLRDPEREVAVVGQLLNLKPDQIADLNTRIAGAARFQAVPVASGLDYDQFAAVSVRLPELPGVVPQRGYSRFYPTGPAVGHLLGYVGAANKEEYDKEPSPLLVTPGFKLGKDGLEKQFEQTLRGEPGARRTEVTASGRIVRDLETREDVQGQSIKLTIDGQLQDFAARRIGLQSAAVVVIDCQTGGILTMTSMPSFDPNTFANGIGRIQWKMLNEDDHIPLLNKAVRGLYPPGSTVKPMATLALQLNGVSPDEKVNCPGGYQLGNRFFRCDARHGVLDMRGAIEHSCNTYFWSMVHRIGYENVAPVARKLGLGQEFDLPGVNQRYGTVPDPQWKMRRYKQEWTAADALNAAIGQGYVLVSPLQLAVMTSRIASGRDLVPSLLFGQPRPMGPALPFTQEQMGVTRDGMFRVVNGSGTGAGSRLPVPGRAAAGRHRPGGDRRAGGPAAHGAAPADRCRPPPGRSQGAGRSAVRGRPGHRAGDHLLAGRGGPVLLLPQGGRFAGPGHHRVRLRPQGPAREAVPAGTAGAPLGRLRGSQDPRPHLRPRPPLLRRGQGPQEQQARLPVRGPQDPPAGPSQPGRARRRRARRRLTPPPR